MYIFNSFSSRPKKLKWLVFIPTTCRRLGPQSYPAVIAEMMRKLSKRGYYKDILKIKGDKPKFHHGFDVGKFVPSAIFYLPGTNASYPEAAFFLDFNGPERTPVNPYNWIKHAKPAIEIRPEIKPLEPIKLIDTSNLTPRHRRLVETLEAEKAARLATQKTRIIEEAEASWQNVGPRQGHDGLFRLARTNRKAGLGASEASVKLEEQAFYSQSRYERRREIKGLLRQLW